MLVQPTRPPTTADHNQRDLNELCHHAGHRCCIQIQRRWKRARGRSVSRKRQTTPVRDQRRKLDSKAIRNTILERPHEKFEIQCSISSWAVQMSYVSMCVFCHVILYRKASESEKRYRSDILHAREKGILNDSIFDFTLWLKDTKYRIGHTFTKSIGFLSVWSFRTFWTTKWKHKFIRNDIFYFAKVWAVLHPPPPPQKKK